MLGTWHQPVSGSIVIMCNGFFAYCYLSVSLWASILYHIIKGKQICPMASMNEIYGAGKTNIDTVLQQMNKTSFS